MHNHYQEVTNGLHSFLSHKQHPARMLVEKWIPEGVSFIIVWRQIRSKEQRHFRCVHGFLQHLSDKNSEAIDDKVGRAQFIDVHRYQVSPAVPLSVFDINVGPPAFCPSYSSLANVIFQHVFNLIYAVEDWRTNQHWDPVLFWYACRQSSSDYWCSACANLAIRWGK